MASWQDNARSTQAHTDSSGNVLWQEIQCTDGRHQATKKNSDGSVTVYEDHGTPPQQANWVQIANVTSQQVNDAVCATGAPPPSNTTTFQCNCSGSSLACSLFINGAEEPLPHPIDIGSATECTDMLALSKVQNRFCIGNDLYFLDTVQAKIRKLQSFDSHGYCLLVAANQNLGAVTADAIQLPPLACANSQNYSDGIHAWPNGGGCQYYSDGTHCWFPDGGCQYYSDGTHCWLPHGDCTYTSSGTNCTFDGRAFASIASFPCHN